MQEIKHGQDVLLMVHIRNQFYRKKCYYALGAFLATIVLIVTLLIVLYEVARKPTLPLYFVADRAGRLISEVPLQAPYITPTDAAVWAIKAVEAAYSYDFVNYRAQLQDAQKYFTEYGWKKYLQALVDTNNLVALTQRKFIIQARVIESPKLMVQGVLGGAYAWKFQMRLLVTYYSPPYDEKSKFQNPLMLTVIVQRQKLLSSYQGLGIVQMIGTLAQAPEQQTISPTI